MNVEILQALIETLDEGELRAFTTWFERFLASKEKPDPLLPAGLSPDDKDALLQNWAHHIMDPMAKPQSVTNLLDRLKRGISEGSPGEPP